ncbi:MAG: glycosyl hydrolase, partial [Flavobacteriaceae bacterium]|nr:glycosyl hydrolase [Flavobacteriaceae bacterium]
VNEDGTGKSKVFIASEKDLEIHVLPNFLQQGGVSFLRVVPWNWVSKKGTGGDILGMDNSWFYRWSNQGLSDLQREYTPMAWGFGAANDDSDIELYKSKYKSTHVLGFNEPDDCEGQSGQYNHLCDVPVAISVYENLMKTGLRLVSPACRQGAVFNWLNSFNQEAVENDIRIDVIAVHWYDWGANPQGSPNANPNTIFNRFKTYLEDVYELYGLPIWITEFNGNKYRSTETNRQFMELAIPYLESVDFIERYAWFEPQNITIADDPGNGEFFDDAMNLTDIGTFYNNYQSTPSIPEDYYVGLNNLNDEVLTNQYTNTCNPVSSLSTPADDYTQNVTLKVIPNPATNKIKIIFSEPIKSIKLYSITGSFINKQLINGYIDVSDLPIGVYFLSVNQYPIKFLKQ